MGKWKGIRKNGKDQLGSVELYNLETDIQEKYNIAQKFPEIVQQVEDIMKKEHQPAVIPQFKQKVLGD